MQSVISGAATWQQGYRRRMKRHLLSATGFVALAITLGACVPETVTEKERAETLVEALATEKWTQAEPYDLDFRLSTGPIKTGLEDSIGAASLSAPIETETMSGGAVNITYIVFEDYEQASSALRSFMEGIPGEGRRIPIGQSRYCIEDLALQDECGAVSGNVMLVVLSRLKMSRLESDPHTEELMDLALAHLREVRSRVISD
jgi:hypothetical protein